MNRKQREMNRANARDLRKRFGKKPVCPNCGQHGSHFVPPFLGESGFFVCGAIAELEAEIGPSKDLHA
jgi:hypothetical protein